MPQNHNINISLDSSDDGILVLSDNGETDVDPGDTVTWKIAAGSSITDITNVFEKTGSTDVFNPDPARVGSSSNWRGTVSSSATAGAEEDYSISYTVGTTAYTYDPKIKVNT